jgi:hypothetical protein
VAETLESWHDEPMDEVASVLAADSQARKRASEALGRRTK